MQALGDLHFASSASTEEIGNGRQTTTGRLKISKQCLKKGIPISCGNRVVQEELVGFLRRRLFRGQLFTVRDQCVETRIAVERDK
jgi:hypothetical protein